MPRYASIQDLAEAIERRGDVIVDIRPMAAYNGWALRQEMRGGHVAGAIPFPLSWFDSMDDADLIRLLGEKGISPDKSLIVYGYGLLDSDAASTRLADLNFSSIQTFSDGIPAWAADPAKPMDRMPHYKQLIYPEWLLQLIASGVAPEYEGNPYVLAHVSFDNRDDYDQGHIPGAIFLDTLFLEEPEHWNRRNPKDLEQALLANGITCDTMVLLYGRNGDPSMDNEQPGRYAGEIAAMRAALLLMYAGVRDVRILNGGLNAWISEGQAVSTEPISSTPVEEFGRRIPACPDYVIDIEEAKDYLSDPMSELVCMRSWQEFIGEKSGYHYIGPKGRIPGAIFGNCGSDAYHMQNYRNHDNTMLCYHEIESNWREVSIVPEKRIAFYCGTGWRASEAFFYAYLMGWDRIAVYDGGWYEWSIDARNPTEVGVPTSPLIKTRRF
jgi:3-mercaptopyruvate sulfurtransferase SseA